MPVNALNQGFPKPLLLIGGENHELRDAVGRTLPFRLLIGGSEPNQPVGWRVIFELLDHFVHHEIVPRRILFNEACTFYVKE
jgi:hypothetical protein